MKNFCDLVTLKNFKHKFDAKFTNDQLFHFPIFKDFLQIDS